MKVAKNMDSVFDNSTQSELNFEIMFDEDDCLIDLVAGVNEAGELITGPNPEDTYEYQLDENGDPINSNNSEGIIEDKDDDKKREGEIKDAGDPAEGTVKDADDKLVGSPEGMAKEVPGTGNSEESKAHDVTKDIEDAIKEDTDFVSEATLDMICEGDEAKKGRKALAKKMEAAIKEVVKDKIGIGNVTFGGFFIGGKNAQFLKGEGKTWLMAIHAKHQTRSTGYNSDGTYSNSSSNEAELKAIDDVTKAVAKEKDVIKKAIEDGAGVKVESIKVNDGRLGVTNVEVTIKDFPGSVNENASEGPIEDKDDDKRREGEVKDASNNVEGEKQEVIGAAQESADAPDLSADDIDTVLDEEYYEKENEITLESETETAPDVSADGGEQEEGCSKEACKEAAAEEICKSCGKPISQCKCSVSESIVASILKHREIAEGVDTSSETDSTFEDELKGAKEDPITDKDDDTRREGDEKDASNNVEGEKQEVIGAAQESGELDQELKDGETVTDDVQTNGSANIIPKDADTQAGPGIEPATEAAETKPEESQDDKDIEAVNNGDFDSESNLDLQADYDDDELIDMVVNGEMV